MENKKPVEERINLDPHHLLEIEKQLSYEAHVKRYRFCRPYAHGRVLDCACGIGYGTFLLQQNPDVREIIGVDISNEAIDFATKNYKTDKTSFVCSSLSDFTDQCKFDVLISLETIEHLRDPRILVEMAKRNGVSEIILSYPSFKSTHFNPHHYHDFEIMDIERCFNPFYQIYDSYDYLREVMFVFLRAPY